LLADERNEQMACISDIHGNLEALTAVLKDIKSRGIQKIICAGDIVGYGADPCTCIDIIRENNIPAVQGNHDAYTCFNKGRERINRAAYASILWTRKHVSREQKAWLSKLPLVMDFEAFTVVHSSLKNPDEWNYILNIEQAERCFSMQEKPITIIGHSHRPYIFCKSGGIITENVLSKVNCNEGDTYILNAGSVGQPRDKQYTATYLIFDPVLRSAAIERVAYDVEATKRKIFERGLPEQNATRLTPPELVRYR